MPPNRSPRILYINNTADIYGASRSLLRLLPAVKDLGYHPFVLLPEPGPLKEKVEQSGVQVFIEPALCIINRADLKSWRCLRGLYQLPLSVLRLHKLIRAYGIDLVHTNTGVIISPALSARLARVPHVWHIRDSFQEFRGLWKPYARYILAFSNAVVANSISTAEQFPASDKVKVVYNGVALEEFDFDAQKEAAAFRSRYKLGDAPVVGCVGRIKFIRKGQEILVQAAKLLKERGLKAKYLIVGSTAPGNETHLTRLQNLIREYGLESDVVLTGDLDDVRAAYSCMDVLVLPSAQTEPFGNVISEAMALKIPVVATRLGGALEQVVDGETGFLVPPGDPSALAAKLEPLLQDSLLRQRMGRAGYQRLLQCFSLDQTRLKLDAIYKELLSQR